jgi:hypothetical protein
MLHLTKATSVVQLRETANYRGYAKWKEAKAALTKLAPVERIKLGGALRTSQHP